jgi:predicted tellurium resistance membrane protein TerC
MARDNDPVPGSAADPWAAMRPILVADFVMSLDNVLGWQLRRAGI